MNSNRRDTFGVADFCECTRITFEQLTQYVEQGIVDPGESGRGEWSFSYYDVTVVHKARRIQREFELDPSAIALVLDLLDDIERLRRENNLLHSRLSRFLDQDAD